MNAGAAPTCPTCGGLNTNPQLTRCHYCGSALPMAQVHGAPPPGYGPTPSGYGAPPPGYGPAPYGQPPQPYGQVHGFGGNAPFHYAQQPVHYHQQQNAWRNVAGGFSTFFWVRLGIAAVAIGISLLGACVSAISH